MFFFTGEDCKVVLQNVNDELFTLDQLDEKIRALKLKFRRGSMPPTISPEFKRSVGEVIKLLNIDLTDLNQFLAMIGFLKYHPDVNEVLLKYAVAGAELERDDISHIILNPFKVIPY